MITGSDTLQKLLQAVQHEQARMKEVDGALRRSNDEVLALDAQRVAELRRLAALRLSYLSTDGRAAEDAKDEAVLKLMARRDEAFGALQRSQQEQEAAREKLQAARGAADAELASAMRAVDDAEAATQARLATDGAYLERLEAAREADRVAQKADDKATQSEAELLTKGEAYRSDPLFWYLWRRSYGTPDYHAGGLFLAPLIRYLDSRVARLVAYDGARANYARLQEIPVRLREHATRAKAAAQAAHAELERLDLEAREADGIGALEQARDAARAKVAELDSELEAADRESSRLQDAQHAFAEGADADYQSAVEYLRGEFDRSPLTVLRAAALATPMPEDDLVVARLADLSQRRDELTAALQELNVAADANHARLKELTDLRAEFTRAGMAQPGSGFRDARAIDTGISQYLAGLLTAAALWQLFRQQHTVSSRADPTFGSGGFGRGTVWGGGQPAGGGAVQAGKVIGSILDALGSSQSAPRSGGSSTYRPSGGSVPKPSSGGFKPGGGGSQPSGGFKTGGTMPKSRGFKTGGKF